MRIEQSQVALASRRLATVTDTTRSSMEAWIGDRPTSTGSTSPTTGSAAAIDQAAIVRLSAAALSATRDAVRGAGAGPVALAEGAQASGPDPTDPLTTDPKLSALVMLIERLTGQKVHLIRPEDINAHPEATAQQAGERAAAAAASAGAASTDGPPQKAGWGVEVRVEETHQETENTGFTAAGQVITADGKTISFDYRLEMRRELTQTSTTDIQAGDAVKKIDPIAINLSDGPVALSSDRTSFDLNSDGTPEQVALPASGTYFLAIDRDGNGRIDNGGELFGPATGNGFTELKSLDTDRNGWIDEGDAAYASLRLWSGPDAAMRSLDEAKVGALYVGQAASTQFDLRSGDNETMGQVVSSSLYLGADGKPGAMQQVDLTA
jgi:hypothetical protein